MSKIRQKVSTVKLFGYALGEGAVSITMNGIGNFAMLFYTQILGLSAGYAGTALSVTLVWDAITDPLMGHLTDNTRSRFGRRLPYVFFGGFALAVSFLLLWVIPQHAGTAQAAFWAVLLINLLVRTAVTVFVIPYTALGFEIAPEYNDRSRLQGIRIFVNQASNFIFGACAWVLFFGDKTGEDGARIDGTLVESNYVVMGVVLAIFALMLILGSIYATRDRAVDNRNEELPGNNLKAFVRDFVETISDRLALIVILFFTFANLGMMLVSQVQMFTYVFYMEFTALQKTIVHGGGMIATALAALWVTRLIKRFDKKALAYIGIAVSIFGGLVSYVLFSGGLVARDAVWMLGETEIPIAVILFGLGQALWWGGTGIVVPTSVSMIADVSAANYAKSGQLKDGSYSAIFGFVLKLGSAVGLLITGWLVDWAGIISQAESQTLEAINRIASATFLSGPAVMIIAFVIVAKYPLNRAVMEKIDSQNREKDQ
ncbi:MFS transporter [Pelagicoccus mobilis]|uniref:MFS transporter n=1 Tax=Pelagicoccus mobilis TaxID=415221 RepID=A0A934RWF7_9BACT|nr:MFS transporter [Pelagicoccus mobilis]